MVKQVVEDFKTGQNCKLLHLEDLDMILLIFFFKIK